MYYVPYDPIVKIKNKQITLKREPSTTTKIF